MQVVGFVQFVALEEQPADPRQTCRRCSEAAKRSSWLYCLYSSRDAGVEDGGAGEVAVAEFVHACSG